MIVHTFSKSGVLGSLHAATRQNELAPSFLHLMPVQLFLLVVEVHTQ